MCVTCSLSFSLVHTHTYTLAYTHTQHTSDSIDDYVVSLFSRTRLYDALDSRVTNAITARIRQRVLLYECRWKLRCVEVERGNRCRRAGPFLPFSHRQSTFKSRASLPTFQRYYYSLIPFVITIRDSQGSGTKAQTKTLDIQKWIRPCFIPLFFRDIYKRVDYENCTILYIYWMIIHFVIYIARTKWKV